ncbi:hypothetical protein ZONE111905_21080 [Zobellia nedashkovskayae]
MPCDYKSGNIIGTTFSRDGKKFCNVHRPFSFIAIFCGHRIGNGTGKILCIPYCRVHRGVGRDVQYRRSAIQFGTIRYGNRYYAGRLVYIHIGLTRKSKTGYRILVASFRSRRKFYNVHRPNSFFFVFRRDRIGYGLAKILYHASCRVHRGIGRDGQYRRGCAQIGAIRNRNRYSTGRIVYSHIRLTEQFKSRYRVVPTSLRDGDRNVHRPHLRCPGLGGHRIGYRLGKILDLPYGRGHRCAGGDLQHLWCYVQVRTYGNVHRYGTGFRVDLGAVLNG